MRRSSLGEVRANSKAQDRPMPDEAPVMTIVLPDRRWDAEDMARRWVRRVGESRYAEGAVWRGEMWRAAIEAVEDNLERREKREDM